MCPTPPPVTTGPQPAPHQFEFDGGAQAAPERTETKVSRPLPHVTETTTQSILHIGANATLVRYVTEGVLYPRPIDRLVFRASAARASIFVTRGDNDSLLLDLNHERYRIKPASAKQIIEIHTLHGNDTVYIADTLKNTFHIETGPGNDTVVTGSGKVTVLTGTGDDIVMTRDGASHVDTGDGNDIVNANGSGTTVAYTGRGADFFRGGAGMAFIHAGEGDDVTVGGQGHSIVCGGDGDDLITAGAGSNVIYGSQGQDILNELKDSDKVFTDSEPATISKGRIIPHKKPANAFIVSPEPLSESGLIIQGSETFIDRVQDDLKLLLGSGSGSQLLRELTKSIRKSQKPITIAELKYVNNGLYIPNLGDGRSYIQVGMAGLPDFGGTVYYNPTHSLPGALPLTALYHELCHAYNFVTGTRFMGSSPDGRRATKQAPLVSNEELQATGLPCSTEPFDFDKDPATPALLTNPSPYSENGMLEELGLALRKTYIYYSDD
ncbi:hypothetical protein CJU81_03270 [Pseudomonas fragi]|uniref:Uncharacterized protein n=1 Tax=Pseudomonas fragi TaxID=296 RepID=A0A267ARL2_PSEFR|nr:hypothetical protein CJU81_03270 [Pseudomonas fragi]